jgi:hypothetical protein
VRIRLAGLTVAAALALAAPAVAQALDLGGMVRKVEKRTVQNLLLLARYAEQEELHATARRIHERVLELDADNRVARARLGFRRVEGAWVREEETAKEVAARKDGDAALGKKQKAAWQRAEDKHLADVVRVCVKYGTLEQRRPILEPLLARLPRRADLHEALGHVKVGDNYARPGMVEMVKLMPWRLQVWHNRATDPVTVDRSDFARRIPGLTADLAYYRAAASEVASALPAGREIAVAVARTQGFLRLLLGDEAARWQPSPVLFLQAKPYAALVRALHPDAGAFKLYSRFENYEHADFYAIRVYNVGDAAERYAHGAGYHTMFELAAPAAPGAAGKRNTRCYAWLLEGFGYLVSLEMFDRAHLSFVSIEETATKRVYTRAPPAQRTRANCLQWLREQVIAGHAYPLREVCSKSLNNLDFCASMQAYTFLRFLFLYEPAKAKGLPPALRAQAAGPQADRADRALREVFGLGLADLERFWRAFVVEIE